MKKLCIIILSILTSMVGLLSVYCFCKSIWDAGSVFLVMGIWGACIAIWWNEMEDT